MSFPTARTKRPLPFAVLKVNFSFYSEVAEAKSLLSRNRHTGRDAYQSQQGMMKNDEPKNEARKN
jgi:uncharacterized membrane protein